VFFYFRAYESEWCLGSTIGGVECYARSVGSHLRVIPDPGSLNWYSISPALGAMPAGKSLGSAAASGANEESDWSNLLEYDYVLAVACLSCVGLLLVSMVVLMGGLRSGTVACPAEATCDPMPSSSMPSCIVSKPKNSDCEAERRWADAERRWADDASSVSLSSRSQSSTSSSSRAKRRSTVACVVCFEAPREILLEPCRHVCCCKACGDRLDHCPMCRAVKVSFTEVFLFREPGRSSTSDKR